MLGPESSEIFGRIKGKVEKQQQFDQLDQYHQQAMREMGYPYSADDGNRNETSGVISFDQDAYLAYYTCTSAALEGFDYPTIRLPFAWGIDGHHVDELRRRLGEVFGPMLVILADSYNQGLLRLMGDLGAENLEEKRGKNGNGCL